MRRLALLVGLFVPCPASADAPEELIDPTLSKWVAVAKPPGDAAATWRVEGGVLKCGGKPTGYLATKAAFERYKLTLEYRYPPSDAKRPNSGILVHIQPEQVFWPLSYEVQLAQGQVGDVWLQAAADKSFPKLTLPPERLDPKNPTRHYFRLPGVAEKPYPAWNAVEIIAVGDTLEARVNGVVANRATGLSLTKGKIGLQAEGVAVEFRGVRVAAHAQSGGE